MDRRLMDDLVDKLLFASAIEEGDVLETEFVPGARARRRRADRRYLRMQATQDLLDVLQAMPAAGESIHVVSGAKFDFWTWVPALIQLAGQPAAQLYVSTWTLSRANAVELFDLLDTARIQRADFLTGTYFKRRETAVYTMLLEGLLKRGGRYRAFRNHAKVMLLDFGPCRLVIEGSANLTANPRLDKYVFTRDDRLYEFHRTWMEEVFTADQAALNRTKPAGDGQRVGFLHRRAGLGVMAATNSPAERRRTIAWKLNPTEDADTTAAIAAAVAELVRTWSPSLPARSAVTTPPQGASWPGPYFAELLGRAIAKMLGVPYVTALRRAEPKARHSMRDALDQAPFKTALSGQRYGTYIVVDDMITTGRTMRLSLEAIRAAGKAAFGFAYNGS